MWRRAASYINDSEFTNELCFLVVDEDGAIQYVSLYEADRDRWYEQHAPQLVFGLDADWHTTDQGNRLIYETDPVDIDEDTTARVIYELRLDIDRLNAEAGAYAEQLRDVGIQPDPHPDRAWAEDPDHPVADWQYEVANGDTRLGYTDWVAHRKET